MNSAPIQDIPLQRIDGSAATLADCGGEVLLIVNVASQCGPTPQYEGLEKLLARFAPDVAPDAPALVAAIESALGGPGN